MDQCYFNNFSLMWSFILWLDSYSWKVSVFGVRVLGSDHKENPCQIWSVHIKYFTSCWQSESLLWTVQLLGVCWQLSFWYSAHAQQQTTTFAPNLISKFVAKIASHFAKICCWLSHNSVTKVLLGSFSSELGQISTFNDPDLNQIDDPWLSLLPIQSEWTEHWSKSP